MPKLFLLLSLFLSLVTPAALADQAKLLEHSRQLVLILTPDWDSLRGEMQVYQRSQRQAPWQKVGESAPVVVGQSGMAWGVDLAKNQWAGPVKKEGDLRTPVGVFKLTPAFGFGERPRDPIKVDYFQLDENSVCVDDEKSKYYNQLLDASKVVRKDWGSAELMREVPLYKWGAMVQYNTEHPQAGAGSCIFFHIWRRPDQGTAGCVGMAVPALLQLLGELEPGQEPVVALISLPAYTHLKKDWDLPKLNNHAE